MDSGLRVTWIEDDALYVAALSHTATRERRGTQAPVSWEVSSTLAAARERIAASAPHVIVLDVHLTGGESGLTLLPELTKLAPGVPVLVHSVLSDYATVVEAMRLGAYDYLPKQAGVAALLARVRDLAALTAQNDRVSANGPRAAATARPDVPIPSEPACTSAPALLGESPPMVALRAQIARIRAGLGGVLITGESGSGKELVARALCSEEQPFVAVDAATLAGPLGLATLLGHERGAYTGAEGSRPGLFERAHGGMLFIDEVANMPLDVQAQLLRALEQRTTTRLGGTRERKSLFRLVCATHANLEALCRRGLFRFDLLMRMRVFVLGVPPLRERSADIVPLFEHFLRRFKVRAALSSAAQTQLLHYSWPGNVRELLHAAEHAATLYQEGLLTPEVLPPMLFVAPGAADLPEIGDDAPGYHAQLAAFGRRLLETSYAQERGNISRMAHKLGLERASLHHKLCALGIHTPRRRGHDVRATP